MKALILQHSKACPAGSTISWLEAQQIKYDIAFLPEIQIFPTVSDFDLLIICGGGMNVDQENLYPWLRPEKNLIRQAIDAQKKVVGLCLGAQLIAEVMGAHVGPHTAWETGWHRVQFTDGTTMPVFEWHAYTFGVPPGAELFATNSNCAAQGFRFGEHVIGFQFHPEATEEWIIDRFQDAKVPTEGFVQTKEQVLSQMQNQRVMQDWYFQTLNFFITRSRRL